eukprot:CAMPEP_0182461452 /NCGR_PEP_ID=MMETSP1319-20130603/6030_1 /TAXON_ID=172717 /ORGANISM="Bolidomonas pacifica, Strain RCC208" /LENGTH=280 /DNA_ID=CAMNT_0024660743 /DNA_START=42 /DNA_END=879 /DNA_ORIENTATION=-
MASDGGVWASEHKASFFSAKTPDVARDEVDDLIKSHLNMKDEEEEDEEEDEDSVITETEEEMKERVRKEELLKRGYSDYMEFEEEQKQHKSLAQIALDSAADARAASELKSRAHSLFNFTHPSQRDITSKLPPLYKPAFPRPTSVTVGDPNPSASYYITTETYDGDSSPSSKLQNTPFTVYTVRDAIKHRVVHPFLPVAKGPCALPGGGRPLHRAAVVGDKGRPLQDGVEGERKGGGLHGYDRGGEGNQDGEAGGQDARRALASLLGLEAGDGLRQGDGA